jgi:hypothetical protein
MSLREKLALMNTARPVYTQGAPQQVIIDNEDDLAEEVKVELEDVP